MYSALIFLNLIIGLGIPLVAVLIFFIFVPGYGIIENFLRNISSLEKVATSIGISLALFLGLRGLVEASKMQGILPELTVISILAVVSLTTVLIRK